ncbi:TPA_exp: Uncharacterized protein A8136_6967 [Trichophyton benhamiae CBS 112371]|nr:TPA_exp: Uncharacterized protein A8136_6967 [Trichophyton benhamiae CBS 112371]
MAANPAAARVRENQRRSRARRKEYIQDLEARLQRYERHGVDVTIEVQTAARKVARQNVMLRSLLNSFGVTDAKIDEYLAYAEEHNSSPSSAPEKRVLAAAPAPATGASGGASSGASNNRGTTFACTRSRKSCTIKVLPAEAGTPGMSSPSSG